MLYLKLAMPQIILITARSKEVELKGFNSNYNLLACDFEYNSKLYLNNLKESRIVNMNGCNFSTSPFMNGLTIEGYSNVSISSSNFTSLSNGIMLYNCGKRSLAYIRGCEITYCSGTGVLCYNSSVTVSSNKINNNGFGIRSYDHNNIAIYGNCASICRLKKLN